MFAENMRRSGCRPERWAWPAPSAEWFFTFNYRVAADEYIGLTRTAMSHTRIELLAVLRSLPVDECLRVLREFHEQLNALPGDDHLVFTESILEQDDSPLSSPDVLRFMLDHTLCDGWSRPKALATLINANRAASLQVLLDRGWVSTAAGVDKIIDRATAAQSVECAACLMEYKHRAF